MNESIGSLVIDIEGTELNYEDVQLLKNPCVGGVILFRRNYENKQQLKSLCAEIRNVCPRPILIMADQEGGRVQRFISEFTKIPPSANFGELYEQNQSLALDLVETTAWLLASELLEVGVDLGLSPVIDLKKINLAIGDRAYHADPKITSILGSTWMQGLHGAGMSAVAKHFPGHGSVLLDSHLDLPIDGRPLRDIEREDLIPFEYLIEKDLRALMVSHVVYPEIDTVPVGFSAIWLQDILRKRLKFTGAIFSDDLSMAGAAVIGDLLQRVQRARQAGCDFILCCNQREALKNCLDQLNPTEYQVPKMVWGILMAVHPTVFSQEALQKLNAIRARLLSFSQNTLEMA